MSRRWPDNMRSASAPRPSASTLSITPHSRANESRRLVASLDTGSLGRLVPERGSATGLRKVSLRRAIEQRHVHAFGTERGEHELLLSELNPIAIHQLAPALDALAVDEHAIGAVEVLQLDLG